MLFESIHLQRGDHEKAHEILTRQVELKEEIVNSEKNKAIEEIQAKYETEKKEQEIEDLKQEATIQNLKISKKNNQILIGSLGGIFLLISGILLYRQQITTRQKQSLELQQRFLRSQLNPHFIFNSMSAIQNYFVKHNSDQAGEYMAVFSVLMRQIPENSRQEFITLKEEISMLERYLQLQQLRFREKLNFDIYLDEDLDQYYTGIPPMFAQPFIENALEHGLFKKEGEHKIQIRFSFIDEGKVGLEIIDSGIGVTDTKPMGAHKSLAMTITKERLEAFTSKGLLRSFRAGNLGKQDGTVDGYRVSLTLPGKLMTTEVTSS